MKMKLLAIAGLSQVNRVDAGGGSRDASDHHRNHRSSGSSERQTWSRSFGCAAATGCRLSAW